MKGEIWKPIPSYPGYEASSEGRIKSKERYVWVAKNSHATSHAQKVPGGVCTPGYNNAGYQIVSLTRKKKTHTRLVHRLVLEAFAGPCPEGKESRHLDGDQNNNSILNLRWGTRAENIADRYRTNGGKFYPNPVGGRKLTARKVKNIRRKHAAGARVIDLAEQYDVSVPAMYNVVKGISWSEVP